MNIILIIMLLLLAIAILGYILYKFKFKNITSGRYKTNQPTNDKSDDNITTLISDKNCKEYKTSLYKNNIANPDSNIVFYKGGDCTDVPLIKDILYIREPKITDFNIFDSSGFEKAYADYINSQLFPTPIFPIRNLDIAPGYPTPDYNYFIICSVGPITLGFSEPDANGFFGPPEQAFTDKNFRVISNTSGDISWYILNSQQKDKIDILYGNIDSFNLYAYNKITGYIQRFTNVSRRLKPPSKEAIPIDPDGDDEGPAERPEKPSAEAVSPEIQEITITPDNFYKSNYYIIDAGGFQRTPVSRPSYLFIGPELNNELPETPNCPSPGGYVVIDNNCYALVPRPWSLENNNEYDWRGFTLYVPQYFVNNSKFNFVNVQPDNKDNPDIITVSLQDNLKMGWYIYFFYFAEEQQITFNFNNNTYSVIYILGRPEFTVTNLSHNEKVNITNADIFPQRYQSQYLNIAAALGYTNNTGFRSGFLGINVYDENMRYLNIDDWGAFCGDYATVAQPFIPFSHTCCAGPCENVSIIPNTIITNGKWSSVSPALLPKDITNYASKFIPDYPQDYDYNEYLFIFTPTYDGKEVSTIVPNDTSNFNLIQNSPMLKIISFNNNPPADFSTYLYMENIQTIKDINGNIICYDRQSPQGRANLKFNYGKYQSSLQLNDWGIDLYKNIGYGYSMSLLKINVVFIPPVGTTYNKIVRTSSPNNYNDITPVPYNDLSRPDCKFDGWIPPPCGNCGRILYQPWNVISIDAFQKFLGNKILPTGVENNGRNKLILFTYTYNDKPTVNVDIQTPGFTLSSLPNIIVIDYDGDAVIKLTITNKQQILDMNNNIICKDKDTCNLIYNSNPYSEDVTPLLQIDGWGVDIPTEYSLGFYYGYYKIDKTPANVYYAYLPPVGTKFSYIQRNDFLPENVNMTPVYNEDTNNPPKFSGWKPDSTNKIEIANICDAVGANRCCKDSNGYTGHVCNSGQLCYDNKCYNINSFGFDNNICIPGKGSSSIDDCLKNNKCPSNCNATNFTTCYCCPSGFGVPEDVPENLGCFVARATGGFQDTDIFKNEIRLGYNFLFFIVPTSLTVTFDYAGASILKQGTLFKSKYSGYDVNWYLFTNSGQQDNIHIIPTISSDRKVINKSLQPIRSDIQVSQFGAYEVSLAVNAGGGRWPTTGGFEGPQDDAAITTTVNMHYYQNGNKAYVSMNMVPDALYKGNQPYAIECNDGKFYFSGICP